MRRVKLLHTLGVQQLIDVGANDGGYGRELRRSGYDGRIISCEPLEEPSARLTELTANDQKWTTQKLALGRQSGDLVLNVSELDVFSSPLTVSQETLALDPRSRTVRTETAPMVTLDEFAAEQCDTSPLGLKIDVQGYEAAVLDGGPVTLARCAFLEIELSPTPMYEGDTSMVEMLQRLRNAGLALTLVDNVSWDPRTGAGVQVDGIFTRQQVS